MGPIFLFEHKQLAEEEKKKNKVKTVEEKKTRTKTRNCTSFRKKALLVFRVCWVIRNNFIAMHYRRREHLKPT